MIIYVDGDACPVNKEIISLAQKHNRSVVILKSYAHFSHDKQPNHVTEIYVDSESEAVDYKLTAMAKENDLVVTQDYGLASLVLQKKCQVIHPRGFHYTNRNIDRLLLTRHQNAQIRKSGGRTKGPAPYTEEDRQQFIRVFSKAIS